MRKRFGGATFGAVAVAIVILGGCGGRSAAQKAYLVSESGSLGRCTMGEAGDFGAPFDAARARSWDGRNDGVATWARVLAWRIASPPKDPPGDFTVRVNARFDLERGDRGVLRRSVGAHEPGAKSIAKALDLGLDVFVEIRSRPGEPYVEQAIGLDETGKLAWLEECGHRASDAMADSLERANVDPARVGPAVRKWIADGDTYALLRAFARK